LWAGGINHAGVKKHGGRSEVFDIADDERLIGCKLDEDIFGHV
jgi:hypothetical protein